jgi:hypothetical protein
VPPRVEAVPRLAVRQFFLLTQPLERLETLQEVEFILLYYVKGMSPDRVAGMDQSERTWWMKRLLKEKKAEQKAGGLAGLL